MQVNVEESAKHKAVKTHKIQYEEAGGESPHCYFSPDHKITKTQSAITEAKFGFPLCPECVQKVGKIVDYVVELNFR